jgi:uncharacterized protein (TIGR03086 family)
MDAATLYRRTVDSWTDLVRAVGDDAWDRPTPCSEWTVRDLVNHVTGEDLWAVPLLQGSTIEEVGDRFDGDVLGDDPVRTALEAASEGVVAVDERAVAGGTVHLSYGEESVEEYVRQVAADHLVHGWDLAVALGDAPRFDADLVAEVAGWFADREELYRSVGAIGPRPGSYDDPQDELVAGFGRDPGWRRSQRGA